MCHQMIMIALYRGGGDIGDRLVFDFIKGQIDKPIVGVSVALNRGEHSAMDSRIISHCYAHRLNTLGCEHHLPHLTSLPIHPRPHLFSLKAVHLDPAQWDAGKRPWTAD